MAEIVGVGDLTPGKVFLNRGDLFTVIDIQHNKTAMAKMKVKVKVKNLRSGAIQEMMFFGGDKVEIAYLDKKTMSFLYSDDSFAYFMDKDTFDQIQLPRESVKNQLNFLAPDSDVDITYYGKEIIGIQLPAKVTLKVTQTDDFAIAGDTVNRAMKPATLETGYTLKVPLFVKTGESIIVRTDTGEYDSRAETK